MLKLHIALVKVHYEFEFEEAYLMEISKCAY